MLKKGDRVIHQYMWYRKLRTITGELVRLGKIVSEVQCDHNPKGIVTIIRTDQLRRLEDKQAITESEGKHGK